MRNIVKRVLLLWMIVALLCACLGCEKAPRLPWSPTPAATPDVTETPELITPEPLPPSLHPDVRFSDMRYVRPDTDAIESALDKLADDIASTAPAAHLLAAYADIKAQYEAADSAMALCYLLYAFDVTEPEYEEEYARLQSALSRLDLLMTDVTIQLYELSDETRNRMDETYTKDYVDAVYQGQSLNSDEIQPLLDAEQALISEYDRLSATFTLLDGGKEWTLDDIYSDDSLTTGEYYRLVDAYYAAFNESAGRCYLELTKIRHQIAQKLGYGSYGAYGYDCYARDYTVEDAKALHQAVKTHIAPLFATAQNALYSVETVSQTSDAQEPALGNRIQRFFRQIGQIFAVATPDPALTVNDLYGQVYDQNSFLSEFASVAEDFSPSLSEGLQYLLKNSLLDLSVNPKKMSGSFTTYISEYQAPFIFSQWENNSASVDTFIHEFGHFSNYYHNPFVGWSMSDSLDLAEVDSQALQLLMTPYYDRLYGAKYGQIAEHALLLDCMFTLISGCMEDEFQQTVYENPDMTLAEMNAVYYRLAQEYRIAEVYAYNGTEWVTVPHTFQTPMYYISYAASMVPALELWEIAQTDFVSARTAYLKIIDRAPYTGFRDELKQTGLSGIFDEATIAGIARMLATQL